MEFLDLDFVKDFMFLCGEGYRKGWHERNGGNLSYRLNEVEVAEASRFLSFDRPFAPIGTSVPTLRGAYFLVTGSGKFMMNVNRRPEDSFALIRVGEDGETYQIVWGLSSGGRPTSELPTHLMNHEVIMKRTEGKYRVVYHCHPANLIALTFILPLDSKVISHILWEMATECPIVFPAGVGVVSWMVPGGREIAVKTAEQIETYDAVLWAHHGIFGVGESFDSTFGLIDTVEKSAEIYEKILASGKPILQTITNPDFKELAKAFKVELNPEILGE